MINPFASVDRAALNKYEKKLPQYGNTWKRKSIEFLKERMMGEAKECFWSENDKELYEEALDLMNMARMLAKRSEPMKEAGEKNG